MDCITCSAALSIARTPFQPYREVFEADVALNDAGTVLGESTVASAALVGRCRQVALSGEVSATSTLPGRGWGQKTAIQPHAQEDLRHKPALEAPLRNLFTSWPRADTAGKPPLPDVVRKVVRDGREAPSKEGTMIVKPTKQRKADWTPATGTEDTALQRRLISQLSEILYTSIDEEEEDLQALAIATLNAFEPEDAVEEFLVVQMAALSHNALDCLRRAALENQKPGLRDLELRNAAKLLDLNARLLERLERRRRAAAIAKATKDAPLSTLGHRF